MGVLEPLSRRRVMSESGLGLLFIPANPRALLAHSEPQHHLFVRGQWDFRSIFERILPPSRSSGSVVWCRASQNNLDATNVQYGRVLISNWFSAKSTYDSFTAHSMQREHQAGHTEITHGFVTHPSLRKPLRKPCSEVCGTSAVPRSHW